MGDDNRGHNMRLEVLLREIGAALWHTGHHAVRAVSRIHHDQGEHESNTENRADLKRVRLR